MKVNKRDGRSVDWSRGKVQTAVLAALRETGEGDDGDASLIAQLVERGFRFASPGAVNVETVQDEAERQLMLNGYMKTAKAYILYREEHARKRERLAAVPDEARMLAAGSKHHFPNALSEFVYYRTYSRWDDANARREVYPETVRRYMSFMHESLGGALSAAEYGECEAAILAMEVMPSMRLMWSAGDAARATNVSAFNCSYIAPSSLQDFGEILYILACGTGVGFSSESRNVQELPVVRQQSGRHFGTHVVGDSKEGWANALVVGLERWYAGEECAFDYSQVRPEGAKLRTMGGRSSGPKLLEELLGFARRLVLSRQGRRLSNLDVHDLVCKIGECIISGGVRRSALISLSDLDDPAMRDAKQGHFFLQHGHRVLANNSAVYEQRPPARVFMREWLSLSESGSGERGIFNRGGLADQVPERRLAEWAAMGVGRFAEDGAAGEFRLLAQVGTNPCGEINLVSKQFCNLTEVVCRHGDDVASLLRKVHVASVIGTYQSTLTRYPYLSQEWKANCERERLLGVSLTGQWDCPAIMQDNGSLLAGLLREAQQTNREFSGRMGINSSTAITCGKPSGTVSQLVDAASGGHPRFAPFYVRRVRISASDPMYKMLRDQGVPHLPENGQTQADARTFVFEFPVQSPPGARCAKDVTALQQLQHWLTIKEMFTEHNPSVTIYVGDDEWEEVGHWVWQHFDRIGGLSFLPREDHVYALAPYEEITAEEYARRVAAMPSVDYAEIAAHERDDQTLGSKELACAAGACEIA